MPLLGGLQLVSLTLLLGQLLVVLFSTGSILVIFHFLQVVGLLSFHALIFDNISTGFSLFDFRSEWAIDAVARRRVLVDLSQVETRNAHQSLLFTHEIVVVIIVRLILELLHLWA